MIKIKKTYYLLALAILPLVLFLQNKQLHEPVHQTSFTLLKPFILLGDSVAFTTTSIRDNVVHFWNSFQEQSQYETRIAKLEGQLVDLKELQRENARLKELLAFKEQVPTQSVAARVMAWDLSLIRKTVVLDKGTLAGVKKDMAVMTPHGLMGRVLEAGPASSRVLLLKDPESRVSVMDVESRSHGVAAGDGSPELYVKYIELDSKIAVGSTLLTSGVGGLFPKGLPIGNVQSIERDHDGLHLIAKVNPFVHFSKIEEVLCLDYSQQS